MSTKLSSVTALAQLHIDTNYPSPATARVAVIGEVDLATAPTLRDRLLTVLHDQTFAVLEVDLAGVTFLDCAGIGALVAVRNAAVRAGRQMRVTHPQPVVRRVLELTGLLGVLTAPIGQPQPLPTRSGYPSRTGPTSAIGTQPPDVVVGRLMEAPRVADVIAALRVGAGDCGRVPRPAKTRECEVAESIPA